MPFPYAIIKNSSIPITSVKILEIFSANIMGVMDNNEKKNHNRREMDLQTSPKDRGGK